jgi:large subunit ribosomal protein LX
VSDVRVFRVEGEIRKPNWRREFTKEFRATKPEEALERVYTDLGSKHRAKRFHIKITSIKEIKPEEAEGLIVRELSGVRR